MFPKVFKYLVGESKVINDQVQECISLCQIRTDRSTILSRRLFINGDPLYPPKSVLTHLHMIGPFKIAVVVADMSALFMETSIVYCYEPIYQRQQTGLCK